MGDLYDNTNTLTIGLTKPPIKILWYVLMWTLNYGYSTMITNMQLPSLPPYVQSLHHVGVTFTSVAPFLVVRTRICKQHPMINTERFRRACERFRRVCIKFNGFVYD